MGKPVTCTDPREYCSTATSNTIMKGEIPGLQRMCGGDAGFQVMITSTEQKKMGVCVIFLMKMQRIDMFKGILATVKLTV